MLTQQDWRIQPSSGYTKKYIQTDVHTVLCTCRAALTTVTVKQILIEWEEGVGLITIQLLYSPDQGLLYKSGLHETSLVPCRMMKHHPSIYRDDRWCCHAGLDSALSTVSPKQ